MEEVRQINEQVLSAAAKGDFSAFIKVLDDAQMSAITPEVEQTI